jgi:hypothetical protein
LIFAFPILPYQLNGSIWSALEGDPKSISRRDRQDLGGIVWRGVVVVIGGI